MMIYSIRHGKTDMNAQNIFNGRVEEDINEEGISQAKKARDLIKDKKIDLIYCSPMIRTRHTCEIINEKNVPVIYDDRLLERTLGDIDGKNLEEEGITKEIFYNYNYKFNNKDCEDIPMVFERVHSLLDEIVKNNRDKNVLLVTHGAIMRAIYFYFNTTIPENGDVSFFKAKNCELYEYDVEKLMK